MKFKILMIFFFTSIFSFGQDTEEKTGNGKDFFDQVYNSYSGKKISTIILKDGTKIEGFKKDVDRKKGQIYYVKIKDKNTGEKLKFNSDQIKEMYLYPGGLEKFGKTTRYFSDTRQWERNDLDIDILKKDYIYFKNQKVSLKNKKKEKEYLMQLINPSFSKFIEVFGDPFAKETTGVGAFGLNLAGGLAKSYYVKKNGVMFWLHKKEFKKRYDSMFGDCDEFLKKYPTNTVKWRYFSEYVLEYTKMKAKINK